MRAQLLLGLLASVSVTSAADLPKDATPTPSATSVGTPTIDFTGNILPRACPVGAWAWLWTDSTHTQCKWLKCVSPMGTYPAFLPQYTCAVGKLCQYVGTPRVPACV
ncbi:hypothetical protein B0H67DRAFT_590244 [Lasiosphaeris hirsuta]|uniref:Secreted protein n=1 Tax=Lasiosphaeris hirsuta TaxID=260670 RepID=A0AA40A364_9PEZI|nr:hypothetical protein B0H67DRAFT_590244 [Lasiosphaeris hirsuta]